MRRRSLEEVKSFIPALRITACDALAILSVVAVTLVMASSLHADEVEITIFHTNDLHQSLEPLPRLAGYVADYKRDHPNTVFVDAGDWFDRGSSLVRITQGETLYGAMEQMGYDMWIVGNHDWAYGGKRLVDLIKRHPVPVLATNLATTRPPLPKNVVRTVIKEFAGVRVGFFGITLDTYGTNPKYRPDLYVLDCRVETAKAVAELKKAQVDLIVAVTHLGFEKMKHEVGRSFHPSDQDLVAENPGIDIVIGGHSHTLLKEETVRGVYDRSGAIITQAGASARHVGQLTFRVSESDTGKWEIKDFDVKNVPVTDALPEHPAVAAFLKHEYAEHMPNAKTVVGRFAEPIQFHNLAYWYADFIRTEAAADICLMPRKTLYDEPRSFAGGEVDVERLMGYLYDRYMIKATVKGSDLLKYCDTDARRDLFNPFHHQGRPFSGDAMFFSGFDVAFEPETGTVEFGIEPSKSYTLAIPWPFTNRDLGRYRYELPPRSVAAKAEFIPGLSLQDAQVLPRTTRESLVQEGTTTGLYFYSKFAEPLPDWAPWTKHFEAKQKSR
jgi:Calcineurin-like phosphoesterase